MEKRTHKVEEKDEKGREFKIRTPISVLMGIGERIRRSIRSHGVGLRAVDHSGRWTFE